MGELLISKGADINAKDIIYQNTNSSFLIMIIQFKERNLNINNDTPLHSAAEKNAIKMGELLISKGANINAKGIIYQNMKSSFLIIIIQFKERNLNINKWTPLHIAAGNDSVKMGELLISKGADINAKDIIYQNAIPSFLIMIIQFKERNLNQNNETPLHRAAIHDSIKIGILLISKGADINAKTIIYQNMISLF